MLFSFWKVVDQGVNRYSQTCQQVGCVFVSALTDHSISLMACVAPKDYQM
jgi:hypothetical protein